MYAKQYYESQIKRLKDDIAHIKRHIEQEVDPEEKSRLYALRAKLLTEQLNYMGALEKE